MRELIIGHQTLSMLTNLMTEKNKIEAQIQMIISAYVDASGQNVEGQEIELNLQRGTISIVTKSK